MIESQVRTTLSTRRTGIKFASLQIPIKVSLLDLPSPDPDRFLLVVVLGLLLDDGLILSFLDGFAKVPFRGPVFAHLRTGIHMSESPRAQQVTSLWTNVIRQPKILLISEARSRWVRFCSRYRVHILGF
jgi:hypothetical protein